MGQGKRTSGQVIQQVETTWNQDQSQSATAVWQRCRYTIDSAPELRKVQQIIRKLKEDNIDGDFQPPAGWQPWENTLPAADVDYLLRLDALNRRVRGRHLYQEEAKWARCLRVAVEGLDLYDQLWVVEEYYRSERFHHAANRAAWDGALAYKPWFPDNAAAYECALIAELVPMPPVFTSSDMEERLDLLRQMLEMPDGAILARYNALRSFWSGVMGCIRPSDYLDYYPADLNPNGPANDVRTIKARAISEVGNFWVDGKTDLRFDGQIGRPDSTIGL